MKQRNKTENRGARFQTRNTLRVRHITVEMKSYPYFTAIALAGGYMLDTDSEIQGRSNEYTKGTVTVVMLVVSMWCY